MLTTTRPRPRRGRAGLLTFCATAWVCCFGATHVSADVITLLGGDDITADVVERHDDRIVIEHEALGRLEIPRVRIVSIDTDVEQEKEAAEAAREPVVATPGPAAPSQEPKPRWKSSFTLGGSGSFGNTDTQNLTTSLSSKLDQGAQVTKVDLNYYLDLSNGDRTDNRFNANIVHDWLMPESPWLYFVQSRYDYDQFQSWEHRLSAHAGLGYRWVDTEVHVVSLRIGVGASKEWKSEAQAFRPELLGGSTGIGPSARTNPCTSTPRSFPTSTTPGNSARSPMPIGRPCSTPRPA